MLAADLDFQALLHTFPATKFAMGYGSGVFPQRGYKSECHEKVFPPLPRLSAQVLTPPWSISC
jgi:hypothetical protein